MDKINTHGIVLKRMDYREADRIVRFITIDQGKVSVIAKGVRKAKSKLAGGLELFSISEVGYVKGKSDLSTLVSCRLDKHFANIVKDIDRTMLGYSMLKIIDKTVEDHDNQEFYRIIETGLGALDDLTVPLELIEVWFVLRVLDAGGSAPNFMTDTKGNKLEEKECYSFDFETMSFIESSNGDFGVKDIKFFRVVMLQNSPTKLKNIVELDKYLPKAVGLCRNLENFAV